MTVGVVRRLPRRCSVPLLATQHANPLGVYNSMFHSALLGDRSLVAVVLRAVPIVLAALAVSVPARAGLVNVGGEGQLIMGAVAATGIGVLPRQLRARLRRLDRDGDRPASAAGALWAGSPECCE